MRSGDLQVTDPRDARRIPEQRSGIVGDRRERATHGDGARTHRHLLAGGQWHDGNADRGDTKIATPAAVGERP
jgi:hypothetical protein